MVILVFPCKLTAVFAARLKLNLPLPPDRVVVDVTSPLLRLKEPLDPNTLVLTVPVCVAVVVSVVSVVSVSVSVSVVVVAGVAYRIAKMVK